jgi:hypothetical protein
MSVSEPAQSRIMLVIIADVYIRFEVFAAVTMKNAVFWDFNATWPL